MSILVFDGKNPVKGQNKQPLDLLSDNWRYIDSYKEKEEAMKIARNFSNMRKDTYVGRSSSGSLWNVYVKGE